MFITYTANQTLLISPAISLLKDTVISIMIYRRLVIPTAMNFYTFRDAYLPIIVGHLIQIFYIVFSQRKLDTIYALLKFISFDISDVKFKIIIDKTV